MNVQGTNSDMSEIEAGVPQGSILGPLLFILYISDLPKDTKVKTSVFADDTSVLVSAPSKASAHKTLQKHLNKLSEYYSLWKIKINVNKTEVITFSERRKVENSIPILNLNSEPISEKTCVKYLGIHLQSNLKFNYHINEIIKKSNLTIRSLYPNAITI